MSITRTGAVLVGSMLACAPQSSPDVAAPDAPELLARLADSYVACATYQDAEIAVPVEDEWVVIGRQSFSTRFARDGRLRFAFVRRADPLPGYVFVVHADREGARNHWTRRGATTAHASASGALHAAAGVSGRASTRITGLLMPDAGIGSELADLADPRRRADEVLDGVECFVLEGAAPEAHLVVWVAKEDFTVRRIVRRTSAGPLEFRTTARYDPTLDEDLGEDAFVPEPTEAELVSASDDHAPDDADEASAADR